MKNFSDLVNKEESQIGGSGDNSAEETVKTTTGNDHTREPRVLFRTVPRAGLALSGGGIRSATYSLGVLQALEARGVLEYFDYLSTVSGGGYAGAYWTRSRQKDGDCDDPIFNRRNPTEAESPPIRHMREYSRFLAPRLGLLNLDVWWPAAVILSGLCLTLLAGCSLILLVMSLWGWVAEESFSPTLVAVTTAVVIIIREWLHYWSKRLPATDAAARTTILTGLAAIPLWLWFWTLLTSAKDGSGLPRNGILSSGAADTYSIFCPALAWLLTAFAIGGIGRMIHARVTSTGGPAAGALERATGRLLGMAALWAAPAGIWTVALALKPTHSGIPASIGGGLAALFVLIRGWADEASVRKVSATVFDKLRAHSVKIVAVLAILMLFLTAALALVGWRQEPSPVPWSTPLLYAAGTAAVALVLYRPNRMGLHSFYRSRIARCYLGAATAGKDDVRYSAETSFDDMLFANDCGRPLHLVCCAANQLAGDLLPTLFRGARSAVLSRNGLSMGNLCQEQPDLRLSSAVTASAAAFNSQMGSISQRLGAPVSFMAALLNLRLGLWIPAPGRERQSVISRILPGWLFFLESLNGTTTTGSMLHLSDGGHFENLAAYELVRRHCRYIVIVDASADPDRNFENLGNFVRRVREDFGVEIQIDTTPLRPAETGYARAHAVAGRIVYDPEHKTGSGLLIYIKPSLLGDESEDIRNYHHGRPKFPHESTADQFFDESQWESYRRLGQLAGEWTCNMMKTGGTAPDEKRNLHQVFDALRVNLARTPWNDSSALWNRLSELSIKVERDMAAAAGGALLREAWPETDFWSQGSPRPAQPGNAPPANDAEVLSALVRLLTALEEVYFDTQVNEIFGDRLQDAWLNWIQRWLAIPSLRRWWPLLSPQSGLAFCRFAARCGLRSADDLQLDMNICGFEEDEWKADFAGSQWLKTRTAPACGGTCKVARLAVRDSAYPDVTAAFGLIFFQEDQHGITWRSSDVWLPPGWAGQWTTRLLKAMLHSCSGKFRQISVTHLQHEGAACEADYQGLGFRPRRLPDHTLELVLELP